MPQWGKGAVAVLVTAVFLVMGLFIWREMGMYHFMVLGDARRDAAQQTKDPAEKAEWLAAAWASSSIRGARRKRRRGYRRS
jgi:hypothetical protein